MLLALAASHHPFSSPAFATKIGVSMDKFDDNFLKRFCATECSFSITRRHCQA